VQEYWTAKNNNAQMASLTTRQAAGPYTAPKTAEMQTKTTDKKTSLSVQAQVVMPKVADIPVLQIEPRTIDQAFVDKLIHVFAKGKTVYEYIDTPYYTKEQAQKLQGQMEDELNNPDSPLSKLKAIDPEGYATYKKFLEEKIQRAQAFLKSPDIDSPKSADTSFALKHIDDPLEGAGGPVQSLGMWFTQGPDIVYSIGLEQYGANSFRFSLYRIDEKFDDTIDDRYYESNTADLPSADIGYQEALAQAEQIVSDMGADYMELAFSGKGRYGYVEPYYANDLPMDEFYAFMFTRGYNGVCEQIQRGGFFSGGIMSYIDEASQSWLNEYIVVCIDKEGLRRVEWQSPSTLVKVANENVELAAFEQILNTLENEGVAYLRSLNWAWRGKPYTDEFKIDRISLGMFKIVDPQERGKYLLIPSWQLTGAYCVNVPEVNWGEFDGAYSPIYTQVKGRFMEKLPLVDYMEINALDSNILGKKWF